MQEHRSKSLARAALRDAIKVRDHVERAKDTAAQAMHAAHAHADNEQLRSLVELVGRAYNDALAAYNVAQDLVPQAEARAQHTD